MKNHQPPKVTPIYPLLQQGADNATSRRYLANLTGLPESLVLWLFINRRHSSQSYFVAMNRFHDIALSPYLSGSPSRTAATAPHTGQYFTRSNIRNHSLSWYTFALFRALFRRKAEKTG